MITSPLELKRHLPEPDNRINMVPFLDLCVIGLFFTLYSSRFVFAPGVTIDLSEVDVSARTGDPAVRVGGGSRFLGALRSLDRGAGRAARRGGALDDEQGPTPGLDRGHEHAAVDASTEAPARRRLRPGFSPGP